MGESELDGLNVLRSKTPNVPKAFGTISDRGEYFIVLEYIENIPLQDSDSIYETLLPVYSCQGEYWGWKMNNYVGNLLQKNSIHRDFTSYFLQDRIEPLLFMGSEKDWIDFAFKKSILSLIEKKSIEWGLGETTPRLIQGDLWSGNFLQNKNNKVFLIDPSVSYGHPEQDFAMAHLFGGVPTNWIHPISKKLGIEEGFSERLLFWQIYPLLVHLRLFGGSYLESLKHAVRRYL
ncbi:MAG: fructosamine kinase family protein [Leptospiraceae bacterium]|nr:fructosamine kinase family protein [Leptospiraceae bacterium]MCK6380816.1 fructosamine kinase family protein [Leptospiraceae bacterium]NUM41913.1 fructosamine kinase family protein [Leptospiraceae bacterium]